MIATRANAEKLLKRFSALRRSGGGWCIDNEPVLTTIANDLIRSGLLIRLDDKKTRVGEEWGWDFNVRVKADFAGVELSVMDSMLRTKDGVLYVKGMTLYSVVPNCGSFLLCEHKNTYPVTIGVPGYHGIQWQTSGSPGSHGYVNECYESRLKAAGHIIGIINQQIEALNQERAKWLGL